MVGFQKKTEKGDHKASEELLELTVAAWPDRALVALELPRYDEAISLDPSAKNYGNRARANATSGRLEAALDDYDSALKLKPNDGEYLKLRAFVKHRMGLYDLAVVDYTLAIAALEEEKKPSFEGYCNRGNCYRLLGKIVDSINDLEHASMLDLTNAACRMSLGASRLVRNDFKGCLDYFESAARFGKAPMGAFNNLGLAQYEHAIAKEKRSQTEETHEASDGEDASGTDSDDGFSASVSIEKKANAEDQRPHGWLHDLGGSMLGVLDENKQLLLEAAVKNFDQALEAASCATDQETDGVHIVEVGGPGDICDGVLLVLDVGPRIPGFPVIHNLELQEGELHYNRGRALLSLGQLDEANRDFGEAMTLNATHPHFPHYKGLVFEKTGDIKSALEWHEKALGINEGYIPALYHTALCLHALGHKEKALKKLNTCAKSQPKSWRVVESQGLILQDLNQHQVALPTLRRALELLPEEELEYKTVSARMHFAIAQSGLALDLPDAVHEALGQAQRMGQDMGLILNIKGLLARGQREHDQALKYLTKAIRRNPGEPRLVFDRSQCYMELRRYKEAEEDISRALKLLPLNPTLLYSRALALIQRRSYKLAAVDLEAATTVAIESLQYDSMLWEGNKFLTKIAQPPDLTGELWYNLGCMRAIAGNSFGGVLAFTRGLQSCPENVAFHHELAKSLQDIGRHQEAIRHFDTVLEQQPRNAHALLRRAVSLKCQGEYDRAADDFESAKALDRGNPAMHVDYHKLGEPDIRNKHLLFHEMHRVPPQAPKFRSKMKHLFS
ncbi:hypothetical protein BSKO_00507 [Bryopsis sp. KO-2023]|nr:hypothetical protein BSKO_00507 [Bryopsis sp. KO-2023]